MSVTLDQSSLQNKLDHAGATPPHPKQKLNLLRKMYEKKFPDGARNLTVIPREENRDQVLASRFPKTKGKSMVEVFIEHASMGIAIFDKEMRYLYVNQSWIKSYQLSEDPVGKLHYDLFPEISEEWRLIHQRCLAGEALRREKDECIRLNGRSQYMCWEVAPWYEEKEVCGLIMITKDLTAGHRQEKAEKRAYKQEADQAKGELTKLAYTIAHDLRAPLRHIIAFIKILEEELSKVNALSSEHRRYMSNISGASGKMAIMIDELLAYAKADRQDMLPEKVALNSLITRIGDMLQSQYPKLRLEVGSLPGMYADPHMIEVVFQNLLENAAKFTSREEDPIVSISGQRLGDYDTVVIRDNGVGFNEAYINKLFQLFQRLHPQDEFPGTGIGLANVHQIITRHGGYILASGEEGIGATFTIGLPVRKQTGTS